MKGCQHYYMNEAFDITMCPYNGKHTQVKFHVEVTYHSPQVERYKLSAGKKIMVLEKRLKATNNQWKILSVNFAIDTTEDSSGRTLQWLFYWIDFMRHGQHKYLPPKLRYANKM